MGPPRSVSWTTRGHEVLRIVNLDAADGERANGRSVVYRLATLATGHQRSRSRTRTKKPGKLTPFSTVQQREVGMSGRSQTGHNQMVRRRRIKQLAKKRLIQAYKKTEKLKKAK